MAAVGFLPLMLEHVALEVRQIGVGLEADEIAGEQGPHQQLMLGRGGKDIRRRERDMQKEPDPVSVPPLSQLRCQGEEMVVVDPDQIVRLQERRQRVGEFRVDPLIALHIGGPEIGEIQPVVEDRPQHAVGEAEIVFLVILPRERQRHRRHPALGMSGRRDARPFLDHLAVPAEPDAAAFCQRVRQRHGEAAALGRLGGVRHPVGDHHQPAHITASQGRERRVAPLMMPTIE